MCQYEEVMAEVMGMGLSRARDVLEDIFRTMGAVEEDEEMGVMNMLRRGGWRRKDWGGMETNEMYIAMSMLMDWFDGDGTA